MRALEKKLIRDFMRLWAQGLAIALVLASGVSIFILSFGMFQALTDTRAAYYERSRFADIFIQVRRAPKSLEAEMAAISGVFAVACQSLGALALYVLPSDAPARWVRSHAGPDPGDTRASRPAAGRRAWCGGRVAGWSHYCAA